MLKSVLVPSILLTGLIAAPVLAQTPPAATPPAASPVGNTTAPTPPRVGPASTQPVQAPQNAAQQPRPATPVQQPANASPASRPVNGASTVQATPASNASPNATNASVSTQGAQGISLQQLIGQQVYDTAGAMVGPIKDIRLVPPGTVVATVQANGKLVVVPLTSMQTRLTTSLPPAQLR
jgi:hypothetical protein